MAAKQFFGHKTETFVTEPQVVDVERFVSSQNTKLSLRDTNVIDGTAWNFDKGYVKRQK